MFVFGNLEKHSNQMEDIHFTIIFPGISIVFGVCYRAVCFSKEKGCKRVVLDSVSAYSDALKLYEQYGFKHIARYNENNYADVFMEYRF